MIKYVFPIISVLSVSCSTGPSKPIIQEGAYLRKEAPAFHDGSRSFVTISGANDPCDTNDRRKEVRVYDGYSRFWLNSEGKLLLAFGEANCLNGTSTKQPRSGELTFYVNDQQEKLEVQTAFPEDLQSGKLYYTPIALPKILKAAIDKNLSSPSTQEQRVRLSIKYRNQLIDYWFSPMKFKTTCPSPVIGEPDHEKFCEGAFEQGD